MLPKKTLPQITSRGAALVEYGLLVGLVAVVAIGSVATLGEKVEDTFGAVAHDLSGAISTPETSEVVSIGEAGPTEPDFTGALASWTVTADTQPDNPNWVGYGSAKFYDFGSVTQNSGTATLDYIASQIYENHKYTAIFLAGDQRHLRETHKLICEDREWVFSEVSIADYLEPQDSTRFFWTPATPFFEVGQEYRCAVMPI